MRTLEGALMLYVESHAHAKYGPTIATIASTSIEYTSAKRSSGSPALRRRRRHGRGGGGGEQLGRVVLRPELLTRALFS